jgi:hypothetical protein
MLHLLRIREAKYFSPHPDDFAYDVPPHVRIRDMERILRPTSQLRIAIYTTEGWLSSAPFDFNFALACRYKYIT